MVFLFLYEIAGTGYWILPATAFSIFVVAGGYCHAGYKKIPTKPEGFLSFVVADMDTNKVYPQPSHEIEKAGITGQKYLII